MPWQSFSKQLVPTQSVVLSLPRGQAWWRTRVGLLCADNERYWLDDGEAVHLLDGAPGQPVLTQSGLYFFGPSGVASAGLSDGRVELRHDSEAPLSGVPRRIDGRWHLSAPQGDLPEGAWRARVLVADLEAGWTWWIHERFVYGRSPLGRLYCIGAGATQLQVLGPAHVLLGDEECWTHHSVAGRGALELSETLRREGWGIRSSSGALAGLNDSLQPVLLDLDSGACTPLEGLPLDAHGTVFDATGLLREGDLVLRSGVLEVSWAQHDDILAGPSSSVWDLELGQPLCPPGLVLFGATATDGENWASVDWETGRVHVWRSDTFEPVVVQLALQEDDLVERAWWQDGVLRVLTALGEQPAVSPDGALRHWHGEPAEEETNVEVSEHLAVLGAEAGASRGGRIWGWSTDGLLVGLFA